MGLDDRSRELIEKYLDDIASPEELAELDRRICADPHFADAMARATKDEELLREEFADRAYAGPKYARFAWGAIAAAILLGLAFAVVRLFRPVEAWPELVERTGSVELENAPSGRLKPPAVVVTSAGSSASLRYPDGTVIALSGGSRLRVLQGAVGLLLERGVLEADMRGGLIVGTAQVLVRTLGTRYLLATGLDATLVQVRRGRVVVSRQEGKESVTVREGEYTLAAGGLPLTARSEEGDMMDIVEKVVAGTWTAAFMFSVAAAAGPIRWEVLGEPGSGGAITSLSVSHHDSKRLLVGGDMLGVGLSEDGGDSWQSTFGFHDWNIADFTWHPKDPKVVWVGTMTGPYVSTDGGRTWQLRRKGFPPTSDWHYSVPIEKVLFDPNDPTRLLAFAGSSRRMGSPGRPMWGSVWESRDSGESWRFLCVITANGSSTDEKAEGRNIVGATFAAGSSSRLYAAVDWAGLFVSEDGGRTWTPRNEGLPSKNIERVVAHPQDPNTLWVSLGNWKPPGERLHMAGGIYKSTDAGRTWRDISNGLIRKRHERPEFTPHYKGFDVSRSNPQVMYTVDGDWDWGVIWKSTNGGESWEPVATKMNIGHDDPDPLRRQVRSKAFIVETAYPAGLGLGGITVDPRDPNRVYGWGTEYVVRSRDGGRTWDDATSVKLPGGRWRGRGYSGLCSVNFVFNPWRKGHSVLLAMDAGKCWESTDGLKSWIFRGSDPWPWGGGNDACFTKTGVVYVTTGQFGSNASIIRTLDGKTWSALRGPERGLPSFEGGGVATGIYALPDEPNKVWAIVAGKLYHSSDFGDNWRQVQGAPDGLRWLAADADNPSVFYLSGSKGVFKTSDGVSFEDIGGPKPSDRIRVDSRGRVYTTSWRERFGGLWRYDAGTWRRLHDDRFIWDVAIDPKDPSRIVAITNDHNYHDICFAKGIYVSCDDGRSWSLENEGLAMLRGQAVAFDPFDPELLVFGSFGRGFFKARWPRSYKPAGTFSYSMKEEDAAHARPTR